MEACRRRSGSGRCADIRLSCAAAPLDVNAGPSLRDRRCRGNRLQRRRELNTSHSQYTGNNRWQLYLHRVWNRFGQLEHQIFGNRCHHCAVSSQFPFNPRGSGGAGARSSLPLSGFYFRPRDKSSSREWKLEPPRVNSARARELENRSSWPGWERKALPPAA